MISIPVTEVSQVADARRRATGVAQRLGFDETATGRVSIAVTELATNLVKYGLVGEILLGAFEDETGAGVEIIALDKGPGVADIVQSLRDGHSTGGSAGEGLGAVRRLSQDFDIVSWPGVGTAIVARVDAQPRDHVAPKPPRFASVVVPLKGEQVSGDACATHLHASGWTVMIADGLGHGPMAAQASEEAVRIFRKHHDDAPVDILVAIHAAMKHTRGGAVSVARHEEGADLVFAGIGNVAGVILSRGETRRTVSLAGTAGQVARSIRSFNYPFPRGSLFVLCSDGIGTTWSLDRYPGLIGAHPSLIAGVVYRDFSRGRDDAAVLVARGDPS